jgi:hypothetical protein
MYVKANPDKDDKKHPFVDLFEGKAHVHNATRLRGGRARRMCHLAPNRHKREGRTRPIGTSTVNVSVAETLKHCKLL